MNEIRRNTLISFYYRVKKQLDNELDLILFIQCFNALCKDENHKLENIYLDDINRLIISHKSNKEISGGIKYE